MGTVVSVEPLRLDRTRLVVSRTCSAVTGDKFCTTHGQKGVVMVIPDNQMPSIDGESVDFVMGSTTLVKRGTVSQLYEAWAGEEAYNKGVTSPTIDSSYDVTRLRRPTVTLTNNLLPESLAGMKETEVEYGRIRLMQTCHMTFGKHQYTRKECTRGMRSSH